MEHFSLNNDMFYLLILTFVGIKRPNPGSNTPASSLAKQAKVDSTAAPAAVPYKSKLNEFCQKFHLPTPTYETARNSSKGYTSTLIYNGKVYQSSSPQATKKLAEQNAAQVVLNKLNQAPPPEPSLKDAIQTCMHICADNKTSAGAVTSGGTSGMYNWIQWNLLYMYLSYLTTINSLCLL